MKDITFYQKKEMKVQMIMHNSTKLIERNNLCSTGSNLTRLFQLN